MIGSHTIKGVAAALVIVGAAIGVGCLDSFEDCAATRDCPREDSGTDAGTDSGTDADAGTEAGTDAGTEAGTDAGTDADVDECALGTHGCDKNATCTNTPGSFTCECNAGYVGDGATCVEVDACTPNPCAPNETCESTAGSYTCTCAAPNQVCAAMCSDTTSDSDHCGSCGNSCGADKDCLGSHCVSAGDLQISLKWTRKGRLNLLVTTPNDKTILYHNVGPNDGTDNGQMEGNFDQLGKGPESIFWAPGYTPPSGTYHICVQVHEDFIPALSVTDTVSFVVNVRMLGQLLEPFPGKYNDTTVNYSDCAPGDLTYLDSFSYP